MRWARYIVEKVRYDDQGVKVERVVIRSFSKGELGRAIVWPRSSLVEVLNMGITVIAIPTGRDPNRLPQRDVKHLSLNESKCIRTDEADTPRDFLGDLPTL